MVCNYFNSFSKRFVVSVYESGFFVVVFFRFCFVLFFRFVVVVCVDCVW